jgi:hypothetical protein
MSVTEIYDVIVLIGQPGPQFNYETMIIRQAISMAFDLISHDVNVFEARVPQLRLERFISAIMTEEQISHR